MSNISKKNAKRLIIIAAELSVVLFLIILLQIYARNFGNVTKYTPKEEAPVINAANGILQINSVIATLPDDPGAVYKIGYEWDEDDETYPSVPAIASVYYIDTSSKEENEGSEEQHTGEAGAEEENENKSEIVKYEIVLYRENITSSDDIPGGTTIDNWFDTWKTVETEQMAQMHYEGDHTKGVLVKSYDAFKEQTKTYCTYSYYFVAESDAGIEQYVVEGICHDEKYISDFDTLFTNCINDLSTSGHAV